LFDAQRSGWGLWFFIWCGLGGRRLECAANLRLVVTGFYWGIAVLSGVYGLAMSRRLDGGLGRKLLAAQLTIDETTAMAIAQPNRRAQQVAFWVTGVALYTFWNLGTLIGALTGSAIDPNTFGLDAAFPAGFIAMVWPLFSDPRARLAAMIGGGICLITVPFTPIGVPILLSVFGVLVGLQKPVDAPKLEVAS
jgi:predicted branched-subunit amino acid permease